MRFYYYTYGAYNIYIDDWKNKRYINMRTNETTEMPRSMRVSKAKDYYGNAGRAIPDLCVILITGKDSI